MSAPNSLIIPCLNPPDGFYENLTRLLDEYEEQVEIIIADGGGLRPELLPDRPNLKYWSESDSGQPEAINKGIRRSSGEILGFLNVDDLLFPNALNLALHAFQKDPEIQILYGRGIHINEEGRWLEDYPTQYWNYTALQSTCFICQPATFWRREIHDQCGFFDESLHFAFDYDFWLRVGRTIPFHYLRESYLAKSRLHSEAKTVKYPLKAKWENLVVKQRHNEWIDVKSGFDYSALLAKEEVEEEHNSAKFAELFLKGMEKVESSFDIDDLSTWQTAKSEMEEMTAISKAPSRRSYPLPRMVVDLSLFRPGGVHGGIKPAIYSLLLELVETGQFEFVFLIDAELREEIETTFGNAVRTAICEETTTAESLLVDLQHDLVFSPLPSIRFQHPKLPLIFLCPDLLHLDYPDSLGQADRDYRHNLLVEASRKADLLLTVTQFSRQRLVKEYQVPHRKIWVLPHALPFDKAVPNISRDAQQTPYFIYPANFWIHKNHRTLLVAFKNYLRHAKDPWDLLLTGHPDSGDSSAIRKLIHSLGLENDVRYDGYLTDRDYENAWAGAGALVFPSNYEGFGLPLLEAMAWEIPIIAANLPSLNEVADQAALFVDQQSPGAISNALLRISSDPDLRDTLIKAGRERAKAFDWKKPAELFSNLANNLLMRKAHPVS